MPSLERLQRPFLTVETGEAYQPVRLIFNVHNRDALIARLNELACLAPKTPSQTWNWYWRNEADALQFESLESFKRNPTHPTRLGVLTLKQNELFINLPSFKRACLAAPFFHKQIDPALASIDHADFINKVYGIDERLPHGFTELFKEEELEQLLRDRKQSYDAIQKQCEDAATMEEALKLLQDYADQEANKRLPTTERYRFEHSPSTESEILFLGFYVFLRGRELVAIRRWFGNTQYNLAQAAEETMEKVFGGVNLDIIE